jgi:hypothetical protein
MGCRFDIPIVLTDAEVAIVKEFCISISDISVTAVRQEIKNRREISKLISEVDIYQQNRKMRERIQSLEQKIAALQTMEPGRYTGVLHQEGQEGYGYIPNPDF